MMPIPKSSRPVALFLAALVALVTIAIVANASQSLAVPNAGVVTYNLAAGAISAPITPRTGVPVLVMGVNNTVGNRGVGQVTLQSPAVAPQFIEWTGIESPAGAAITSGFSSTVGTHVLYIDFAHTVDIEVNSATTIRVHNENAAAMTGTITLIW